MTCDITIDVSHHQGNIDWSRVFDAGKRVAIVKATQGVSVVDDLFDRNRRNATAAGLLVFPYHFITDDPGEDQARHFLRETGLKAGEAAALDWEGDNTAVPAEVEACGAAVASAIERVPLGYWGLDPPGTPTATMLTWPRWIPRFGPNDGSIPSDRFRPDGFLFWQYTSKGQISGITANTVDLDLFAGSVDELIAWVERGAMPAPGT